MNRFYRMRAFNRSVNSLRLILSAVSLTLGALGDDKRPVTFPPECFAGPGLRIARLSGNPESQQSIEKPERRRDTQAVSRNSL